jgi:hypothetical protein
VDWKKRVKGKVTEKCAETKPRTWLFSHLEDVITVSHKKCTYERGNRDFLKLGWGRLMVQAIGAYGDLMRDKDLEDLAKEIEEIKKVLENIKTT